MGSTNVLPWKPKRLARFYIHSKVYRWLMVAKRGVLEAPPLAENVEIVNSSEQIGERPLLL